VLLLALILVAILLGVVLVESTDNPAIRETQSSTGVGDLSPPTLATNPPPSLENLTQYVNPFIGTANSPSPCEATCDGDTFPGAAYPLGMVQWSPDTISNPPGGYFYNDSVITGLSLTHFSGRGCQVYEDFPFIPYVGKLSVSPAADASLYYSSFSHSNETARPGYYRVFLEGPNVTATLSVTPRTGVGQFVYPASTASTMIINAGGSINNDSASGVTILPGQDEVTGFATSVVGCAYEPYTVYFAAKFDRPFSAYGTWDAKTVHQGSKSTKGELTGAFLVFDTTSNQTVDVQVGISFVSVANAESNLAYEYAGFDLAAVARSTAEAWNTVLNAIDVQGGTQDETVTFYTALYHVFFNPNIFSDDNGQYLGFDGKVHTVPPGFIQYENIAGWDISRTQIRLLSILAPETAGDVAQSLVNDAQQGDGSIPRWEQANVDSHGETGDSGDEVIAEAYAFGATNFNATGALRAMIDGQPGEREGYAAYAKLGYVPADENPGLATASVTLEYANDDFSIAQFAKALGNASVYSEFLQRSGDWMNLFNATSRYIQPRDANGTWAPWSGPTDETAFQEGDSAQYTWMVTYDMSGLFAAMGGNATAVIRLASFLSQLDTGITPYAWMGNEPSMEVPWEYDFAQAPALTQQVVREIENTFWTDSPGGILGNDDGGTMSAWYVFAAMGLYPEITGVGGFAIGSPLFPSMTVYLAGGHALQIDAPQASASQPYVQGLRIDGVPTSSLWVPWASVQGGATLDFTLGANRSTWGSAPQDAPPSFAP
jgi:predicted alpha-1,2-mannosidase